jgi:hypothetical protein
VYWVNFSSPERSAIFLWTNKFPLQNPGKAQECHVIHNVGIKCHIKGSQMGGGYFLVSKKNS